jgi:hypothetical protein
MDYSSLVYAKLNINYPHDVFAEEYDKFILPNSVTIANNFKCLENTKQLNECWNMVPNDVYDRADVFDENNNLIKKDYSSWTGTSLIVAYTHDHDEMHRSKHGSVAFRNTRKGDLKYVFKKAYADLKIVQFIKQLPITDIIGVRCVSLSPNGLSILHRDNNGEKFGERSLEENHLWRDGYVSITINISNGGKPLFYSLNSNPTVPLLADDPIYLFNDFVYHGVPLVSSRRRQIRITGKPTTEFSKLIETDTIISDIL